MKYILILSIFIISCNNKKEYKLQPIKSNHSKLTKADAG